VSQDRWKKNSLSEGLLEHGESPQPARPEEMNQSNEILNESSLASVYAYTTNRTIGIISACRLGIDPEERLAASASLQSDIRSQFGVIPIEGHWTESAGTPEEQKLNERFYVVIGTKGKDDSGNVKGFLRKHGIKYRQEGVIYKRYDSAEAELHEWSGYVTKIGRWDLRRVSEYYSMLRGKSRTFVFEEVRFLKTDTFFSAYWKHVQGNRNIEYDV